MLGLTFTSSPYFRGFIFCFIVSFFFLYQNIKHCLILVLYMQKFAAFFVVVDFESLHCRSCYDTFIFEPFYSQVYLQQNDEYNQ